MEGINSLHGSRKGTSWRGEFLPCHQPTGGGSPSERWPERVCEVRVLATPRPFRGLTTDGSDDIAAWPLDGCGSPTGRARGSMRA